MSRHKCSNTITTHATLTCYGKIPRKKNYFPNVGIRRNRNISSPITITYIELVITSHKENSGPRWFHWSVLPNIQGRHYSSLSHILVNREEIHFPAHFGISIILIFKCWVCEGTRTLNTAGESGKWTNHFEKWFSSFLKI